jgi:pyruvate/2-oxoglutarate dehydrogenase complex dihydrolipoamide dehydrogenase (E3) component
MTQSDYDITIIGGGSGGLTAARVAASLGANTLLIDKTRLGGDCLYSGCVPSKSLLHIARVAHALKDASDLGYFPLQPSIDMAKVAASIQDVIGHVHDEEDIYVKGVTVKFGTVTFTSPTTLLLDNETITSRKTIIATGSHPTIPAIQGLADVGYLTNETVFQLTSLPKSLVIIGGGPVGVELGQALARLGVHVTLLQGPTRLLPKEDPEVSALLANVLQAEGITLSLNTRVVEVSRQGSSKFLLATQDDQSLVFEADEILLASGRQPNVQHLNLEAAGVAYTDKGIQVNDYLQTKTETIFAIGDVIGGYLFTHVAASQASIAVRNALLPIGKKKVDYRVVPWCIFTDPEVARVGLTPEQAEKEHSHSRIVTVPLKAVDRAQTEHATTGFIKFVLAGKKDEIVGAHLVGVHAGESLGEIALAMQHHMTISDILATIHPYPTYSTGVQQAAFEAYLSGAGARTNRTVVHTLLRLTRWIQRLFRTN